MPNVRTYLWDYDIDEDQFRSILAGDLVLGRLDRDWAAVRLIEYAPYADIIHMLGFGGLVRDWPRWRDRVRSGAIAVAQARPGFPRTVAAAAPSGASIVAVRNADYYFQRLYPWQDEVIQLLRELDTQFYLTGGTAASRGYLNHRFSDALDLFVNDDSSFPLWSARIIDACARSDHWTTRVLVREERYVRASLETAQDSLKLELVNDVPAHIGQIVTHPILGRLDTAENILANKISALIGREEPKDLADIWGFCCKLKMPLASAVEDANSKAAGIFPADIARILCSTTERDWSLVRWIDPPEKDTFIGDLYRLGETLLLDL